MEYPTEIVGDKGIIKVLGDLDTETAGDALRRAFTDLFDRGKRHIVMDLSSANIINSYGVGKIMACHKRLKAEEGILATKPVQGFVKEVFELLMLDKLFPVEN